MREIKFRAWDLDAENRMYGWNEIKLHFSEHIEHERVVVMQYTGLKDKNSKEIYEGDVVQNLNSKRSEIKWSDEEMGWVAKSKYPNGKDSTIMLADLVAVATIEVIGNIYEKPELINS